MLLIVSLCAFAVLYAAASWWSLTVRKIDVRHWAGASVIVLWLAGVGAKLLVDASARRAHGTDPVATAASIAWPGTTAAASAPSTAETAQSSPPARGAVGSVESLIGPLKARLAKQPKDPNGWALLAQSYAYVGDEQDADRAIARAAALGVDRKTLSDRVAAVSRERDHSNWISATLQK